MLKKDLVVLCEKQAEIIKQLKDALVKSTEEMSCTYDVSEWPATGTETIDIQIADNKQLLVLLNLE